MTSRRFRLLALPLALALPWHPVLAQAAPDAEAVEPIPMVPAELDAEGHAAVAGINAFSLELYRRTAKPDENHFISPASVSVAAGLAYRGAKGATADELGRVLHYGLPPQVYLRANAQVLASMEIAGGNRELHTGNAIWLQNGVPLLPDYEQDLAQYAGAGLQRTDFKADPDGSRARINAWVANRTRDKIRNLLQPPQITDRTRSVLVNTIYWKGSWGRDFAKGATRPESFTVLSGAKVRTPLMHQQASFRAGERGGVKAILLPYQGGEIEMAVFLPNSPKALPRFEAKLTPEALARWIGELEDAPARDTVLTLPKMHLEWRADLVETFKAMGVTAAFSDLADFSGISAFPLPSDPNSVGFKISNIIHQTYLDVDEEGSEAAAATAVLMDVIITGLRRGPPPPPPFVFSADKPFLFLLRDRRTKLILFMGRYVAPPAGT